MRWLVTLLFSNDSRLAKIVPSRRFPLLSISTPELCQDLETFCGENCCRLCAGDGIFPNELPFWPSWGLHRAMIAIGQENVYRVNVWFRYLRSWRGRPKLALPCWVAEVLRACQGYLLWVSIRAKQICRVSKHVGIAFIKYTDRWLHQRYHWGFIHCLLLSLCVLHN